MRAALINSEAITIHGWGMYLSRQGCHPPLLQVEGSEKRRKIIFLCTEANESP